MSDSKLYDVAVKIAGELAALRERLVHNTKDPAVEPDRKAVTEVCKRFAPGYKFEVIERESYFGFLVKLIDEPSGNFCMIAPDEPPTHVEEPGLKPYEFHLEITIRHTVELEAEDILEAQEAVYEFVEDLSVGECDEVSVSFSEEDDSFGPGFSLN